MSAMSIETGNPVIEEIPQKEVEIDYAKMSAIWNATLATNITSLTDRKKPPPRIARLNSGQKSWLNERIKQTLSQQDILVVMHGDFAIVLDGQENAYYVIENAEAKSVLSKKGRPLKTQALSGKLAAGISFEKESAQLNVYIDNNAFSHLLYGLDLPQEIPLIYQVQSKQNTSVILFGFNPYALSSFFLGNSAA
jgi:hypothetical protein